jgi:hypothetical protein
MKTTCLLLLLNTLFFAPAAFAQSKTERYCFLEIVGNMGKDGAQQLLVSLGPNDSLYAAFKDTTVITKLKKVELIKDYKDGFNYLGSLGWNVVALPPFPVPIGWRGAEIVCFRRSFDADELR